MATASACRSSRCHNVARRPQINPARHLTQRATSLNAAGATSPYRPRTTPSSSSRASSAVLFPSPASTSFVCSPKPGARPDGPSCCVRCHDVRHRPQDTTLGRSSPIRKAHCRPSRRLFIQRYVLQSRRCFELRWRVCSGMMELTRSSEDAPLPRFPPAFGDLMTGANLVTGIALVSAQGRQLPPSCHTTILAPYTFLT